MRKFIVAASTALILDSVTPQQSSARLLYWWEITKQIDYTRDNARDVLYTDVSENIKNWWWKLCENLWATFNLQFTSNNWIVTSGMQLCTQDWLEDWEDITTLENCFTYNNRIYCNTETRTWARTWKFQFFIQRCLSFRQKTETKIKDLIIRNWRCY